MDFRSDILPHRDRLYRLALLLTAHSAEAEDIVQETMIRAWERRSEWNTIHNIGAWLNQICRNLALDYKKRAATQALHLSASEQETSTYKTSSGNPDTLLDGRESYSLLSNLISQLAPPQDDIVRMREIEGLSYRDIASALGLTEDQVRVHLHRARQNLRERYTRLQNYGL